MEENIKYKISIEDQHALLALNKMEVGAEKLESRLKRVHEAGMGMLTSLGIGFAAFEIGDIIKESYNEYKELIKEQGRLNMLIAGMPGHIELTTESIISASKEIAESLAIDTGQVAKVAADL